MLVACMSPLPSPTAIFQRVRVGFIMPRSTYASVTFIGRGYEQFFKHRSSAAKPLYPSHAVLRLGVRYSCNVIFLANFDYLPAGHSGSMSGSPADVSHTRHNRSYFDVYRSVGHPNRHQSTIGRYRSATAFLWLKHFRYGVKHYSIKQLIDVPRLLPPMLRMHVRTSDDT